MGLCDKDNKFIFDRFYRPSSFFLFFRLSVKFSLLMLMMMTASTWRGIEENCLRLLYRQEIGKYLGEQSPRIY